MKERRIVSLLAALLLTCGLWLRVFADDTQPLSREQQLEADLIAACRYNETLDLQEYDLTVADFDLLFRQLYREGKLPWYIKNGYTYSHRNWQNGEYMVSFTPTLLEESFDRMRYEQAVQELLQSCRLEGLEPWQKALVLHDRLILRCRYDLTLQKQTGYDLLLSGSTICQGYAMLYQDLLQRVGIPSEVVISEAMNHSWNLVQLDGNWYHVDVTWDDPTPDVTGRVLHTHFLKTDEEIGNAERPHYGWETDTRCTDDRFSDAFWSGVASQICLPDAATCYYATVEENLVSLYCRDLSTQKETRIYKEKDNFLDIGQRSRRYYHIGLSWVDGRLWVGMMDKLYSMAADGTDKRIELTYDAEENRKYIRGFYMEGQLLTLQLNDHDDNVTYETRTLSLPEETHSHSYELSTVAPTCAAEGYTLAACDCGLEAKAVFVKPLPHSWQDRDSKKATFREDGFIRRECALCGRTEYLQQPRLELTSWLRTNWRAIVLTVAGVALFVGITMLVSACRTGKDS